MAKETNTVGAGSQAVRIIILIGLLIFIGGGWMWWRNVAGSPRNVFYAMLDNNMKTRGIGREVIQDNGSQKLEQHSRLTTGQEAQASSLTTLSQGAGTSVETQSIGTAREDYVRYLSIKTDQTSFSGQPLNFDSVLNVWGKSTSEDSSNETRGELYGETVLGVVPVGYVPRDTRQKLIDLINEKNIYDTDFSKAERSVVNGRPQYTYDVKVSSSNYILMLKQFATAVGLNQLESLDPALYSDAAPFEFTIIVDIWSRQLVGVTFAGGARTEKYSSHGSEISVTLPERTIPVEELQSRLQNIQ